MSNIDIGGKRLTLLNASVLTDYGSYVYAPLTPEEARSLVREYRAEGRTIQSAIGHGVTAELLSALLDYPVAVNRVEFRQRLGDVALVFKLRARPAWGSDLSREEIEAAGYDLGLLTRYE